MKTLLLSITALLCASFVGAQSIDTGSLSDYDLNKPFGFGAGISGGDGGTTVKVSTQAVQEPMTSKKNLVTSSISLRPTNIQLLKPAK